MKFIYFVTQRKASDWHGLQQLKYNCNQIVSLFYSTDFNISFQNSDENCYSQTYVQAILKNRVLYYFRTVLKCCYDIFLKLVLTHGIHLYSVFMNNIHPLL